MCSSHTEIIRKICHWLSVYLHHMTMEHPNCASIRTRIYHGIIYIIVNVVDDGDGVNGRVVDHHHLNYRIDTGSQAGAPTNGCFRCMTMTLCGCREMWDTSMSTLFICGNHNRCPFRSNFRKITVKWSRNTSIILINRTPPAPEAYNYYILSMHWKPIYCC